MNCRGGFIAIVLLAAGGGIYAAGRPSSAPATRPATRPAVAVLPFAIDFKDDSGTDEDYGQRLAFAIAKKWRTIAPWEVIDRFTIADITGINTDINATI